MGFRGDCHHSDELNGVYGGPKYPCVPAKLVVRALAGRCRVSTTVAMLR